MSYNKVRNTGYSGRWYKHTIDNGVDVTTSVDTSRSVQDSFSGTYLPQYRSIIRAGGNATTGASGQKYKGSGGYFTCQMTAKSEQLNRKIFAEYYGQPASCSFPVNPSLDPAVVTAVTNRAIMKFIQRCNSVRSSIEAGQDLGELKQSLEALVNPLGSLRKHVLGYFPKVKKLRATYKDAVSLRKAVSDTYLEWTFGWNPLASDIAQGFVGLQNADRILPTYPVSATAKERCLGTNTATSEGDLNVTIKLNVQSYSTYSVRIKGSMKTGSQSGSISTAQVLQLQLPDFAVTAWDLLPYSFIADYFVNIGDIISAFCFRYSDLAWVCQTNRTDSVRRVAATGVQTDFDNSPFYTVSGKQFDGNSETSNTSFTRFSPDPSELIPRLQFNLPVSSKPWLNMGAILLANSRPLVPLW